MHAPPVMAACLQLAAHGATAITGTFFQFEGLSYKTSSSPIVSMTDFNGTFCYNPGDILTFSIGNLTLGYPALGKQLMSVADVAGVDGSDKSIFNDYVGNLARFIYSLDNDATSENGVKINPDVAAIVSKYAGMINFNETADVFGNDTNVVALFSELKKTLSSIPPARNYLRRTLHGIQRFRDVKIPIKNNTTPYVLGDIYRPIGNGKYPPIVNTGAYGKKIQYGCVCNGTDLAAAELYEDLYFSGVLFPPVGPVYVSPDLYFARIPEFRETINTHDWVPNGYIKILIDGPGVCNTPGVFNQFSLEESYAFYDAVEWAAAQPWSNGNVGLQGVSYWAMASLNMVQHQPPSVKAMMPFFNDADSYRDVVYNGGIYNLFNSVQDVQCPGINSTKIEFTKNSPTIEFYEDEIFGFRGNQTISADLTKMNIPAWVAGPQEHPGIHVKGSSDTFIHLPNALRFSLVDGDIYNWTYDPLVVGRQIKFFDYFLKGETNNGALDEPKVELKIRTGVNRSFEWAYFDEWPAKETKYVKAYFGATASKTLPTDTEGKTLYTLSFDATAASTNTNVTYDATIDANQANCNKHGAAFVTDPLPQSITLAGYMKLHTWISSTSEDADIDVSVTVLNTNGTRIPYAMYTSFGDVPVGYGWEKVSHRKQDPTRSTDYSPFLTHLRKDYQPLKNNVPVEVEVEVWPGTAHIPAGSRIRVDLTPLDMCNTPAPKLRNATYHNGASNTIYTGAKYPSWIQLPQIPFK